VPWFLRFLEWRKTQICYQLSLAKVRRISRANPSLVAELSALTRILPALVLVGGDATSDNLPPRFSQIQYALRSPSLAFSSRFTPCSNRTPDRAGSAAAGARRVPRSHRRRHRRREVGGATAYEGLGAAGRPALARIHPDRARRGVVDPDPGLWRGRRRSALISERALLSKANARSAGPTPG
jgi:hypothetical protein